MAKQRSAIGPDAPHRLSDLLRLPPGPVDLEHIDPRSTPGFGGGKRQAARMRADQAERLSTLQGQLYAEGRMGGTRNLLLILQGMDTSGKGGTVRHVVGQVDPSGVHVISFGMPTPEERRHEFLWRVRAQLPRAGKLGVFDRSHYEDVVAVRARKQVDRRTWTRRYGSINRFEQQLVAGGTRIVKCFLHISPDEQRARLLSRLDDPDRHWKFDPADLADRERWPDFLVAYEEAMEHCTSESTPWYVVPADRKWYRNMAITQLLIEQLDAMALSWPEPPFDVDEARARVLALP